MATVDGYQVGIDAEAVIGQEQRVQPLSVVIGPAGLSGWLAGGLLAGIKGATGLPAYGTKSRDAILRESVMLDSMWNSAIRKAVTKHVAIGYNLTDTGDSQRRLANAQEVMKTYGGRGIARGLRDYLTTNDGQFVGIERNGTRAVALYHLDSLRCTWTLDTRYPVLYASPNGRLYLLPEEDLIACADLPTPEERRGGIGICAADSVWDIVLKLAAVETYFRAKVSGSRNLSIFLVTGVPVDTLRRALQSSDEAQAQQGFVVWKGSTIVPLLASDQPTLIEIPLAQVPDGFNVELERKDAYLRFANAVGVPVQDLQPLSGQGLGTGTQSIILAEDAEGQGLAAWRKTFGEQINDKVLPPSTTFSFGTNDIRDRKATAELNSTLFSTAVQALEKQLLTRDQALNWLADQKAIPREFLAQEDLTPGGTLSSDEKPVEDVPIVPQPAPALPAPTATKARRLRKPKLTIDEAVLSYAEALRREVRQ